MAEWTLKLIVDLYARYSPDDIANVPEFRAMQQFQQIPAFQEARKRVEEAAVFVRATMEAAAGPRDEVVYGLRLLRRTRAVPQDLELYHDLIFAGYRNKWSTELQDHFDRAYANLKLPNDFFFSFTNRCDQPFGENPVNTAYKHFIIKALKPEE